MSTRQRTGPLIDLIGLRLLRFLPPLLQLLGLFPSYHRSGEF